jgi:hypothetical protein
LISLFFILQSKDKRKRKENRLALWHSSQYTQSRWSEDWISRFLDWIPSFKK